MFIFICSADFIGEWALTLQENDILLSAVLVESEIYLLDASRKLISQETEMYEEKNLKDRQTSKGFM